MAIAPDSLLPLIEEYRYWILVPLTFIEGPMVGFVAGAFSRLGYFDPLVAFSVFILRDMFVDTLWYYIGKQGGKTRASAWLLKKTHVTEAHLHAVRILWNERGLRTMFLGKLSYGIAQIFLAIAGMVGMPFRRFLRYAFIVAVVEYGVLFVGGYLVGGAFDGIAGVLANIQFAITILALVITLFYVFTHFMRQNAIEEEQQVLEDAKNK